MTAGPFGGEGGGQDTAIFPFTPPSPLAPPATGPQGFRDRQLPGSTTSWPSGLTMAASWDLEALQEWGTGMGKEFRAKGSNVQLGPGVCLARVPRNGRNFEYLSGEVPQTEDASNQQPS